MRLLSTASARTCALCAALLLAAPLLAAPPTAEELASRYLEARGGLARLKKLQSVRFTGRALSGFGGFQQESGWAELIARPGKIRSETTLQGLTQVDAYDGKEGWSMNPFGGRRDAERSSADELKDSAREADLDTPLADWKAKGSRLEALGTEDVEGTRALRLRITYKDGDEQTYYLDPDFYLPVRVSTTQRIRGVERTSEIDLGTWQQVAGVWFPFTLDYGGRNSPRSYHVIIERAEANVEADDALFSFPPAGTRIERRIVAAPNAAAPSATLPNATGTPRKPLFDEGVLSGLRARNIGSAQMSGRIAAVTARASAGKTTVFVGAASGGVWKSGDGGTTFKPVFDKEPVQSIGAVTLDPGNEKVVWVGTGEAWTRNSVSAGDGIYKSTDGGATWEHMGLQGSERIARILVHPKNGDVVYACVPGRLWSDSPERGVYKTSDGGKTWAVVLKGPNLSTGCSGLSLDEKSPDTLFAGLWDFRRKGWTFRSGGETPESPSGSGFFKTIDGGKTWSRLDGAGLPKGPWGRVEVAVAPSDPKIVYAAIESAKSGLYRSSDGGATWEARDQSQFMAWRAFYFFRLVVDPQNPERLFKAGGGLIVSEDGGKSFSYSGGGGHGDWHDVWIDPGNTQHVLGGDDGGLWISHDGGSRWWKGNNLPISQFYHVAIDDKDPYQVYGGLQDNSSWAAPSEAPGGISNHLWVNLGGGDGFWTLPDTSDDNYVYYESQGGEINRVDRRTMVSRTIKPTAGVGEKLRFNWNTPIHQSPTQKGVLYIGSQFLHRSRDQGETWERISPDLTTNDPQKQKQEQSGGVTVDNSSAEAHTTLYAIAESPLDAQLVWVGTDDGNLQLTRDGGKSWANVAGNVGLPKGAWVSWVEPSRYDKAAAYACFDRHTEGDFAPHVYKTADYGKSWKRLATEQQGVRGWAHTVREDPVKPGLLFVGTESGLFISIDGGASFAEFKGGGFPSVAVREVQVHPREHDLVIGTHGRGIWIIDDLTPLRALTPEVMAKDAVFLPGRPVQQRMFGNSGWVEGDAVFTGENPAGGAAITWYQRTQHLFGVLKLEIFDAAGKLVDTLPATKHRGLNRVYWSMFGKPPKVPKAATAAGSAALGTRVLPGTYTVRLTRGPETLETKLEVGLDRRAPYSAADRKAQYEAAMRIHALFGEMSALCDKLDAAKAKSEANPALAARLDELKKKIVATKEGGAITGEERLREFTDQLYGAINFWEGRPAKYQLERIEVLSQELQAVAREADEALK
jgi:photosystem II stability/assembly factor-like uncharacterized protein